MNLFSYACCFRLFFRFHRCSNLSLWCDLINNYYHDHDVNYCWHSHSAKSTALVVCQDIYFIFKKYPISQRKCAATNSPYAFWRCNSIVQSSCKILGSKKTFKKNGVQNIFERTINDSKNIKAKDFTKLAAKIHNFYNKTIKS